MTKLYENLQKATSEEDVKDLYIKFLGLKGVRKNLVDIQTNECWFEAKHKVHWTFYKMFTQLFYYINDAIKKGEKYKLNRPDVGWYQICNTLKLLEQKGIRVRTVPDSIKERYKVLTDKLHPQIYEYGILKR